jgi:hypothetical protein
MYINSFLIFYPHERLLKSESEGIHIFRIKAESTLGKDDTALFALWINDQPAMMFGTTNNRREFTYQWQGSLSAGDSIMVQFINDDVSIRGDRNLRIKEFTLNNKSISQGAEKFFLDRGNPFGKYRWNLTSRSYAQMSAHYFINRGIPPEQVVAITNHFGEKRRTYGNAKTLKHWFEQNGEGIEGVNVVSMDYHSRRTWLTYSKLLEGHASVGIISAPNQMLQHSRAKRYNFIGRETISMIYYSLFVLPWI